MEPLLYLTHRIPYPPNKGDKIRSYHLLKHLSNYFDIYLGTFIDDPADQQYVTNLEEICRRVMAIDLNSTLRKIASLGAFISGSCLTLPYYSNAAMREWVVRETRSNNIRRALAFSSSMAQYLDIEACKSMIRVVDFVDVDSEKWRAYSDKKSWPNSYVYAREARKLLEYEKKIATAFDFSLFVSNAEAELFRNLSGLDINKVGALNNGVDFEYFDPRRAYKNPYPRDTRILVFTGAMDYWANVDAVVWFANEIMPNVRMHLPESEFWIVGSRPTDDVKRLSDLEGVYVTGAVEDVRPYLHFANAAVAPLRLARGIQNKVLEAMSMEKPVVATPQAAEGIEFGVEYQSLITENISEMAEACRAVLVDDRYGELGIAGREYVVRHHDWQRQLSTVNELY